MNLLFVFQISAHNSVITCGDQNCTSDRISLDSAKIPICEALQPQDITKTKNIILGQTFYCNCEQQVIANQYICNFTFAGKYQFNVTETNLIIPDEISITFTVSNKPQMQMFCGSSDNIYSATFTNIGGCQPLRSVSGQATSYASCFGIAFDVPSSVPTQLSHFQLTQTIKYADFTKEIEIPAEIIYAQLIEVQMNGTSVPFQVVGNNIIVQQQPQKGLYRALFIYQDSCGSIFIYNQQFQLYVLEFIDYAFIQNLDCSSANCKFSITITNISQFTVQLCKSLYIQDPGYNNFFQNCQFANQTLAVNFVNSFNIFEGAIIMAAISFEERLNIANLQYLNSIQIKLQNVPSSNISVLPFCINKDYENLDAQNYVQNQAYIAEVIQVQNHYSCNNPVKLLKMQDSPIQYKFTYDSCFNQKFEGTITFQEAQADIISLTQPFLVDGNILNIVINTSTLNSQINFSLIKQFYLVNDTVSIMPAFQQFVAPDQLNLSFQLSHSLGGGIYRLKFDDQQYCNGKLTIQLLNGASELELLEAYLFTPAEAKDLVQSFDISVYNGENTLFSFINSCNQSFFREYLKFSYSQSCMFGNSNTVQIVLNKQFYVPSNSSVPLKYAEINKQFVQYSNGTAIKAAILFQFSDTYYQKARNDLQSAIICNVTNQQYYIPNRQLHFYEAKSLFTNNSAVINATTRFDYQLSQTIQLQNSSIRMSVGKTGEMTCTSFVCEDARIFATVTQQYVVVLKVLLINANAEIILDKFNDTYYYIDIQNSNLISGTFQVKVIYQNYCGQESSITNATNFVILKQNQLTFQNTTILTYQFVSYWLSGSSNLYVNGSLVAPQNNVITARYYCKFAYENIEQQIQLESNVTFDATSRTIYANYLIPSNFTDGNNNIVQAPADIDDQCQNTKFQLRITTDFDAENTLTFLVQKQQITTCVSSAGINSRQQTTFSNQFINCNAVSHYSLTSNQLTAADVATMNNVNISFENQQSYSQTVLQQPTMNQEFAAYLQLPTFAKYQLISQSSNQLVGMFSTLFLSCGNNCNIIQFAPANKQFLNLLKNINNQAYTYAMVDLQKHAHLIVSPTGTPSNSFLKEIGQMQTSQIFNQRLVQQSNNVQGLNTVYQQGRSQIFVLSKAQDTITGNFTIAKKNVTAKIQLLENNLAVSKIQGAYLYFVQNQLFGNHQGQVDIYSSQQKCSVNGVACASQKYQTQYKCMCQSNGKFVIILQAQKKLAGWEIFLIVLGVLLFIALVLIIALLIINGKLKLRMFKRDQYIKSMNVVVA